MELFEVELDVAVGEMPLDLASRQPYQLLLLTLAQGGHFRDFNKLISELIHREGESSFIPQQLFRLQAYRVQVDLFFETLRNRLLLYQFAFLIR